jgi:hypothetical protein
MIAIVVLPAGITGGKGWCFSTAHTDIGIEDAVPITFPQKTTVAEVFAECSALYGQLYFNPVPKYEPAYSVNYVNEMQSWW